MPQIELAESPAGPAMTLASRGRARLLDLCDDARAPIAFGCRAARCTTCRVEVLEGEPLLEPAGPEESELLRSIEAPSEVRLGCQIVVRESAGLVRIRWLGPLVPLPGAPPRA